MTRFGETVYDPSKERETVSIVEQLAVFADLIKAGKIRYLGLSNEAPWGVAEFSHLAKQIGLPRVVSIQNAYNLVNRVFDSALAEATRRENIGLLAYSPLAFDLLRLLQELSKGCLLTVVLSDLGSCSPGCCVLSKAGGELEKSEIRVN